MKRTLIVGVVVAALSASAFAQAEDRSQPPAPRQRAAGTRGFIRAPHADVFVPEPGVANAPPSRILYLNDCKPNGCRIVPGARDDSRLNQSSIIEFPKMLSPYAGTAASWDAIVACVRENYAAFTIQIVTSDPGDVPHYEAFAAGLPRELGFPDAAGVASFSCGVIPNAVSFSFLNLRPNDVDDACWTLSQESGHNFGLSHSMLATDAMTYLWQPPRKRFVDQSACIGTQGCCLPADECWCGLFEQNSHLRLLQTFGQTGATPPDIVIEEPSNGASVLPGFVVRATVTDWDGVGLVELLLNDVVTGTLTAAPYELRAPADLRPGSHRVTLRATDTLGFATQINVDVDVDEPCPDDAFCAAITSGHVCAEGRCVAGPPAPVSEGGGCTAGGGAGETAPVGTLALLGLALGLAFRRGRRTDMCQRHMSA